MRKAKLAGFSGFVLGNSLPEDASRKATEFGFSLKQTNDNYLPVLASSLLVDQRCCLVRSNVKLGGSKVRLENRDLFDFVSPIRNLYDRAKAAKQIQERILTPYKGVFSTDIVSGTGEFWNGLSSFHSYLLDRKYLDQQAAFDGLIFNLYAAINDLTWEIDRD